MCCTSTVQYSFDWCRNSLSPIGGKRYQSNICRCKSCKRKFSFRQRDIISDLSDVQRDMIIGTCLAGASLSRTANFMVVSRNAVSRVMTAYRKLGKVYSVRQNNGWKSKLTDRNRWALKRKSKATTIVVQDYTAEDNPQDEHPSPERQQWCRDSQNRRQQQWNK